MSQSEGLLVVWTVMERLPFEGSILVSVAADLETGMQLATEDHRQALTWEHPSKDEAYATTGYSRYEVKPRLVRGAKGRSA